MKLEQFRKRHSLLIEHYQYIEMHLEGIYAALSGKHFYQGLKEVERATLYRLLISIEEIEGSTPVFTDEQKEELKKLFGRRNFWVHECYTKMTFDHKTDDIKAQPDKDMFEEDIRKAELMRNSLFEIKRKLMHPLVSQEQ